MMICDTRTYLPRILYLSPKTLTIPNTLYNNCEIFIIYSYTFLKKESDDESSDDESVNAKSFDAENVTDMD